MKKKIFARVLNLKKNAPVLVLVLLILVSFLAGVYRDKIRAFVLNPTSVFAPQSGDAVSARQLKSMLKNKLLPAGRQEFAFINVHTPYEGEIAGTDTFVPYDQIVTNASSLPKDKTAPIILYCKTGRMSGEAVETIRKLGYTNVRHLTGGMDAWQRTGGKLLDLSKLEESVLPKDGIELPVSWGTLGKQLVDAGVINLPEFRKVVKMTPEQEKILTEGSDEKIKIDSTNSQFVVDILWALGLAQKSIVYDEGPMGPTSPEASRGKQKYSEWVGGFASTGGWNLAKGDAVNYLNKFDFIPLTEEQQKKVGEIAKNVYRPCCGNPTWFPDCNHGMAALAIVELLVSNNVDDATIYRKVLGFNSFWFPDSYLTVATYFARQGTSWDKVDAKEVLGEKYSSGRGAGEIAKKVGPLPYRLTSGGGCGT